MSLPLSKAEEDALRELDIISLNKDINTSVTSDAKEEKGSWLVDLFDRFKDANISTAINTITGLPGSDIALSTVKDKLVQAAGEHITSTISPHSYRSQSLHDATKVEEILSNLKFSKEDEFYLEDLGRNASSRNQAREFPYRRGFGLEARDNWDKLYVENEDGTFRFSSVEELSKMFDEGIIDGRQFRSGLANIIQLKYPEDGEHRQLMSSYEGSRNEDGSINYYDKWDFEINPGETSLFNKFSEWYKTPKYQELPGGGRLPFNPEKKELYKDLMQHLSRQAISTVWEPTEFKGTISEDELYDAELIMEHLGH